MRRRLRALFGRAYGRPPGFVARAPGRVELIGNHTDYNGGPVLGAAVDRQVWVALTPRRDGRKNFVSNLGGDVVALPPGVLQKQRGAKSWANYPLGVWRALPKFGLRALAGFDFAVVSDLPVGAGLSSSAALEVATALVLLAAAGEKNVPHETVAQVARHAENHFVGVPCGLLDQTVVTLGRRNRLVLVDCAGPSFATVPWPAGARFWVFNTQTKHALTDGLYATRHRECLTAARLLGVKSLAEVAPAKLSANAAKLPPVALRRARHVVGECARVRATIGALGEGDLAQVGRLLNASHRSSRVWFENSTPELDFLAARLARTEHVFGARLTGGGFGGAVLALTSQKFSALQARAIAAAYARKFRTTPDVLPLRATDGAALLRASGR
jgi:galactokinase